MRVYQSLLSFPVQGIPILPSNLRLVNGVSAGLEVVGWVVSDPGEVVLVPVPTYARSVYKVFGRRCKVDHSQIFC